MYALSMSSILGDGKLISDNFLDRYRNFRIVLMQEKLVNRIEKLVVPKSKDKDDSQHEDMDPYAIIDHLKKMFGSQSRQSDTNYLRPCLGRYSGKNQGSVLVIGKSNKKMGKGKYKPRKKPFAAKVGVTKPNLKKGDVVKSYGLNAFNTRQWKVGCGNLFYDSTAFLIGPKRQVTMMLDPVRIYATSIYIASMIIALFCALYVHNKLLTFLALILEFGALVWYVSNFPLVFHIT
ncbi:hypothetical protein V8G54_011126 [Vigna mungo]|uniref:Vesicle transport protein n=1 Tax=Vigna mungo TaxID=3915 RepID=A0AAQ3NN79_VIGMU